MFEEDIHNSYDNETCDSLQASFLRVVRRGDKEEVYSILQHIKQKNLDEKSVINARDELSGSTCLHMIAANGHLDILNILIQQCSSLPNYTANFAGNTPLHWALQNKQWSTAQLLLTTFSDSIDVLQKNDFGRSCLTEAFDACDTDIPTSKDKTASCDMTEDMGNTDHSLPEPSLQNDILPTEVLQLLLNHPSADVLENQPIC
jgi:ankyrin repeat protein